MDSSKIDLPAFLTGGGQMAELIHVMDWTNNLIGDPVEWSQTLRSAVSICLNSRFPMSVMWGVDLTMIYNDAYRELIGEKHPTAMGSKASEVWRETWLQLGEMIQDVLQNGIATWAEDQLLVINRNGFSETCYFTSSYSAIRDEDGVIAGIFGTISETSKRVRAMAHELTEQVLKSVKIEESDHRYHNLIHTSTSLILILKGKDLVIDVANDAMLQSLGKEKDVIGQPLLSVIPEIIEQGLGDILNNVYATGETHYGYELPVYIVRNNERELIYYTFVYQAQRNIDGDIDGVAVIANEVTPQAVLNLNLKESEERFRTLADQMPLFAFISEPNEEATISYWNKTWLDYTGQTFDEALGRAWTGIIHAEDIPGLMDVYVPAFKKREPYFLPAIRFKRHDGEYRWHMAKGNPRYLPDGTFMGYIGVSFDIHESKLAIDALRESEERLRNLVEKAPSPICILKGEDMVLEVANEPVYKVWKVDKSALGKPFLEIIPEMKDQPFMGCLLDVLHNGITHYGNEQPSYFNRSNGETETIFFNFVYQPYRENNGAISGVMVLATDVTEQVVARKKMEQQATMVTNLLMTAPAFVCTLVGKEHVYDLINERYQKIFGTRILKYKPILEALPELVGQGIDTLLDKVYNTSETYVGIDIPVTLARDEGLPLEVCYFNFSFQPMYNENGKVYSILVFGYEVTEKALYYQKIKESESHFKQMADLMPSKVTSATPDGGVTYYNKEWLDYTEMTFEELKDFGYHKIMHPDEVTPFQQLLMDAANKGKALEMEMRFMNKQGEYIWHLNRTTPVKDENGNIKMWLGITSDIHHQKTQEEELEKAVINRTIELEEANEKLFFESAEKEKRAAELGIANKALVFESTEKEKRSDELTIANAELLFQNEEKEKRAVELLIANKELQAFTFISSHDLQEPLRKIQTFSTMILEREHAQLSEAGKHNFQRIQASAKRMQALIRDLLSYSHTNITDRKFEEADLNAIIDEVKNDLAETILERNAVIQTGSLCKARIIPFQFRQLMLNLFANALKFSKPGIPPLINITSKIATGLTFLQQNTDLPTGSLLPRRNYCCITFSDNGIGFDPQFRNKIFEVFQRLNGKENYESTGIGLAIVKKITENHNGAISANGELGKGATFHIYIPAEEEIHS